MPLSEGDLSTVKPGAGRHPRIAIVTHSLPSAGGTARQTAFLHRALAESGRYQPEVISLATSAVDRSSVCIRDPKSWFRQPQVVYGEWRGIPYRHIGAYWAELEFQRYRPRTVLDRVLEDYDVVQFAVGVPPWACTAERVNRPVFLWTATTVWADRASRVREMPVGRRWWALLMSRIAQQYERRALTRVRTVCALSQYTLQSIRRRLPMGDVRLAVCGVDTRQFHPRGRWDGEYLLSVGRFSDPRKNVRLLVESYGLLAVGRPSVPDLYVAGDPPVKSWGRGEGAGGLPGGFRFLGSQSEADLVELYRNALAFVLSSDEEGLGLVVLEAMASGIPVVSTRCGGPETLIVDGETGFLVPVGDAKALADAIQILLDDPVLRRRMGEAARQRAVEYFSLPVTGKVFLDAYDEVFSKS